MLTNQPAQLDLFPVHPRFNCQLPFDTSGLGLVMADAIHVATDVHIATEGAIQQVAENADPVWMARALECVHAVCKANEEFTTDDVWESLESAGLPPPREPSAIGPVLRRARSQGWCICTTMHQVSNRVSRHRNLLRVWKSQVINN